MTQMSKHPFIDYLQSLADNQERGALAALRRGLGQPPGTVAEMYRYVVPWLSEKTSRTQETAYYLVAALFALHPQSTSSGNLGGHMAQTRREGGEDALERRFTALLAAHADDLPDYLRQAISFLKSNQPAIPVNWNQLFYDIQNWSAPNRYVQKDWARAFWGRAQSSEEPTTQ